MLLCAGNFSFVKVDFRKWVLEKFSWSRGTGLECFQSIASQLGFNPGFTYEDKSTGTSESWKEANQTK